MGMIEATRRDVRPGPPGGGVAVRRNWPGGDHDIVGFSTSLGELDGLIARSVAYWRRCHYRPRHVVVEISARDFDIHLHRHPCRSPDCPAEMDRVAAERWIGS